MYNVSMWTRVGSRFEMDLTVYSWWAWLLVCVNKTAGNPSLQLLAVWRVLRGAISCWTPRWLCGHKQFSSPRIPLGTPRPIPHIYLESRNHPKIADDYYAERTTAQGTLSRDDQNGCLEEYVWPHDIHVSVWQLGAWSEFDLVVAWWSGGGEALEIEAPILGRPVVCAVPSKGDLFLIWVELLFYLHP